MPRPGGSSAPGATPKDVVEKLSAAFAGTLRNPEVRDGLVRDGFTVQPMATAEYQQYMQKRMQGIAQVACEAQIKVD